MSESRGPLGRFLDLLPARRRAAHLLGGAAATAALLGVCGLMQAPWFALLFVALVPFLLGLDSARSAAQAAGAGAALSVAFVAVVFPWFPAAVQRYSGASTPTIWLIFLLCAPLLEPQFVTFAVARHIARAAAGPAASLRAALAASFVYVGTELLYPKLFFDTLGLGLYPSPSLRQGADLAGVHGLSLLVLLANEMVAAAARRAAAAPPGGAVERARPALLPLSGALALALALFAYGQLRVRQLDARSGGPARTIGVVQANITNYDRLRAEKGAFETVRLILDTHYALSAELDGRASPDLVVWPETVYPTTFGSPQSEAGAELDDEIRAFAARLGAPLVFGAYDAEGGREYNSAFFLSPAEGGRVESASYRKRMLFPLTEWVPAAIDSDWLRRNMPWTGRWERGPGPRVVDIALRGGERASVVPLICYDVLFPGFVAEAARGGADLIVTISNDSWFPDERAPRLHLVSAAFRSIETRLPQVRATNSGISAMIAPTGEITAETRWEARETLSASFVLSGRPITLAVVLGPWLGPTLLLAGSILTVIAARRPRPAQRRNRKRTKAGMSTK